ncbi:MAG: hypothetical protein AAB327_05480 [Actinomycetota bacterium]
MTTPTRSLPLLDVLRCTSPHVAFVALLCLTLGACGVSADIHPRDIDPDKQDLLQSSITVVTTPNSSNP